MTDQVSLSASMRTYLFAEKIYLEAGDESKDETDARGIMDLVWNLLTAEEQQWLDSRTNAAGQVRCPACKGSGKASVGVGNCPACMGNGCSNETAPSMKELEAAALSSGIKEGSQMSRFLLWVGNECYEGREVSNFMVLIARIDELVQMFLAQDKKKIEIPIVGKSVKLQSKLQVFVTGTPTCGKCGKEAHGSEPCSR